MSHVDPDSTTTITEDVRRAVVEKAAVARADAWERAGFPTAKPHMLEREYDHDYRGRIWFTNEIVMEQATKHLKLILCPKCIEAQDRGFGIKGTRFFITIEDDVMAVFPCVGHFVCHHCGFEEWHPMKGDPRHAAMAAGAAQGMVTQRHPHQSSPPFAAGLAQGIAQAQQINQMNPGMINQAALANQLGQGIAPGMGPIWGMTHEERQSLHRLYQQQAKAAPPIVQSREEAEMLLKLAPVERRQAVIQKLRDLGKI